MPEIIELALQKIAYIEKPGLNDLIETNHETRTVTELLTENRF